MVAGPVIMTGLRYLIVPIVFVLLYLFFLRPVQQTVFANWATVGAGAPRMLPRLPADVQTPMSVRQLEAQLRLRRPEVAFFFDERALTGGVYWIPRLGEELGKADVVLLLLFYSFCLEEVLPDDHQVRAIASLLDLSWVYGELSPLYPALGRPSIDPVNRIIEGARSRTRGQN